MALRHALQCESATRLLVWGTWLAVTLGNVWLITEYGLRIPIWDDWVIVPYAAGQQPITLDWLWSFHVDHRIPLPKLIFTALYRLSGQDIRAVMFLNVALLSLVTLLGILVAQRRSGRAKITDAVLPLTLAGIANYTNLLWAIQIHYVSTILLFCLLAYVILRQADWFNASTIALAGACLLCLPLTGSAGIALATPMLAVLPVAAWVNRGSGDTSVRSACLLTVLVTVSLALAVAVYNPFEERPASPIMGPTANPLQIAFGTLQFAAVAFAAPPIVPTPPPDGALQAAAPYFARDWVFSTWRLRALVVGAAAAVAVGGLVWLVARRRMGLSAALGPLGCLACVGALALGIGYTRGGGLDTRYVTLAATLVFTTYLCLSLTTGVATTLASWGLLLTSLALLPWNAYHAIQFGEARREFEAGLERDIRAGVPVQLLGTRYYETLWGDPRLTAGAIKQMRDLRLGPFTNGDLQLNEGPPVVVSEVPLGTAPTTVHNMTKVGDYWQGAGSESSLEFSTGSAQLAGVRIKYTLMNPTSSAALLQVAWSDPPRTAFDTRGNKVVEWGAPADAQQHELVTWIGDRVSLLRVTPDLKPTAIKVDEIVLLLAAAT